MPTRDRRTARLVGPAEIVDLGDRSHPVHLGEGQRSLERASGPPNRLLRGRCEDSGIVEFASGASRSSSMASVLTDMPVPTRPIDQSAFGVVVAQQERTNEVA